MMSLRRQVAAAQRVEFGQFGLPVARRAGVDERQKDQ